MSNAFDIVKLARKITRPNALEYIDYIFEDFLELHGDRNFRDDNSVVGGIGMLGNRAVTVVGIQKGKTLEENISRNFGSPHPEGYRKALRLMKQAEKFNRPIISFINTAGAYCGIGAEERGQGEAIAKNLFEMASFRVPIISIIIGEGGSGGALALAVADEVWMLENSVYSILSPEGFASILWKDAKKAKEAAELMKVTAKDLLKLNIIEKVIPEALGGAEKDFMYTAHILKEEIIKKIQLMDNVNVDEMLKKRYERFRKFGEYEEM